MRYSNGNLISSADASPGAVVSGGLYDLFSQQIYKQQNRWPTSDAVVTQDLILHLDAGNSSSYPGTGTTWTTLSGSNNGSLVNGPTFDSNNLGSIDLDGNNDYVQFNSPMFDPNSAFTFNAWINTDALGSTPQTIVSENNGTGRLQIRFNSSGEIQLLKNWVAAVGTGTFATGTISAQTWHNVCVTRSSNTYSLYLDGAFASSLTGTETFTAGPDAIGVNNTGTLPNENFNGRIAVVMAYDRALSASEILQNYNALAVRY